LFTSSSCCFHRSRFSPSETVARHSHHPQSPGTLTDRRPVFRFDNLITKTVPKSYIIWRGQKIVCKNDLAFFGTVDIRRGWGSFINVVMALGRRGYQWFCDNSTEAFPLKSKKKNCVTSFRDDPFGEISTSSDSLPRGLSILKRKILEMFFVHGFRIEFLDLYCFNVDLRTEITNGILNLFHTFSHSFVPRLVLSKLQTTGFLMELKENEKSCLL